MFLNTTPISDKVTISPLRIQISTLFTTTTTPPPPPPTTTTTTITTTTAATTTATTTIAVHSEKQKHGYTVTWAEGHEDPEGEKYSVTLF
jgi:hypothetical protein